MKNKKLFIFPQLGFCVIALSLAMLVASVPIIIYNNNLVAIILSAVILIALPVVMLITVNVSALAQVSFDKDGVTEYIFGKKTKFFAWSEICEIKGLSKPFCIHNYPFDWIALCTKQIPDNEVTRRSNSKFTMLIFSRKAVLLEIVKYKQSYSGSDENQI